jgi:hypothetical protein
MQRLRTLSKVAVVVFILGASAVAVLTADHLFRCSGRPFSRDEARREPNAQLQYLAKYFVLGDAPPTLVEEEYDPYAKTWMLTFRSADCEVIVIADRCHGTDIGGVNAGCKDRPRPK